MPFGVGGGAGGLGHLARSTWRTERSLHAPNKGKRIPKWLIPYYPDINNKNHNNNRNNSNNNNNNNEDHVEVVNDHDERIDNNSLYDLGFRANELPHEHMKVLGPFMQQV